MMSAEAIAEAIVSLQACSFFSSSEAMMSAHVFCSSLMPDEDEECS